MSVPTEGTSPEPFASVWNAERARVEAAKRQHAEMLSRTDSAGRPLYRVTSGGNVVRTRPITQRLKAKVLRRDGSACVECGADNSLEVAHVEPYRVNGNNDLDNLRTLCAPCHRAADAGQAAI
jgi:hypothetical protein